MHIAYWIGRTSSRVRGATLGLALLLCGLTSARAQQPGGVAPVASPQPAGPAGATRDAYRATLGRMVVHFDFERAPLTDVTAALEHATGVPVRVGEAARRALATRRFKMRYVADRTGMQVLADLAKAAALDAEVTDEGAVIDTPLEVRALRKRLGIAGAAIRVTADDVAKMLDSKRLTVVSVDRPLDDVIGFLVRETGVRYVKLGEGDEPTPLEQQPRVTTRITDEPLRVVLDRLFRPIGWDWLRQGNVILVGPSDAIAAQRAGADDPPDEAPDHPRADPPPGPTPPGG
jgi:hypothetical protein